MKKTILAAIVLGMIPFTATSSEVDSVTTIGDYFYMSDKDIWKVADFKSQKEMVYRVDDARTISVAVDDETLIFTLADKTTSCNHLKKVDMSVGGITVQSVQVKDTVMGVPVCYKALFNDSALPVMKSLAEGKSITVDGSVVYANGFKESFNEVFK